MTTPPITTLAERAKAFKALHVPGRPLVLANAYDAASARVIGTLAGCRAVATASFALARTVGLEDGQLTAEQNLALAGPIAAVAHELGLPLTVDLQDGYGDRLEEVVRRAVVDLGAVGANLEDSHRDTEQIMGEDEAVDRVRRALRVAAELGVPDFVLNARSDTFYTGGELDESIRRGKKLLEAGATTVYIFWPRNREMAEADVQKVIDELDGRVNIQPRKVSPVQPKALTSADIARMGAARISVGPQLYNAVVATLTKEANELFAI